MKWIAFTYLPILVVVGLLLLVMVPLLFGVDQSALASGAVWTVCPDGPPTCDFSVIQHAVDAAAEGDAILVAAGTYAQINHYGGLAQVLFLDKTVTIRGGYTTSFTDPPDPAANPTILDAQRGGRVVYMGNEYAAPVLEGLTITHGDSTGLGGTPYDDDAGAGIYIWGGAPIIRNCLITDNFSLFDGGGIYMRMLSYAQIIDNVITNNQGTYGAGLYVWYSYPLVTGNLIAGNSASYAGGGVWLGVYSEATFIENEIRDNDGVLSSNEGSGGMLGERCVLTLDSNIFAGNHVTSGGSGLTLIRCDATLTNNIFVDNQVDGVGSSLYLTGTNAQLYHNTFSGTTGGTPSGVYLDTHWEPRTSQANLVNTIIVSETTGIYVASDNSASLDATLWGDGAWDNGTDWAGPGSISTGTVNLWGDPHFIHPQAGNYHILANSPAVDAGIEVGVSTDIDGQARPYGTGTDFGADEYWPPGQYLPFVVKYSNQLDGKLADDDGQ